MSSGAEFSASWGSPLGVVVWPSVQRRLEPGSPVWPFPSPPCSPVLPTGLRQGKINLSGLSRKREGRVNPNGA